MFERPRLPTVALLAVTLAAVTTLTAATLVAAQATIAPQSPAGAATSATTAAAATGVSAPAKFERWATITKTSKCHYYDAGQQNTHLVITRVAGGVRFADIHTDVLRSKHPACDRKRARVGIVVVCRVPATVNARHPMTLKVFTRFGDDYVDSTALPAAFELYGLADTGYDVFLAGVGNDFVNGARGRDRVSGGAGNDWLRTGRADRIMSDCETVDRS